MRRIRYSRLHLSWLGVLPFPSFPVGPRHDWFPSSVQEPALRSCPLYTGHHLARSENHPPGSSRDNLSHPGSDVIVQEFRCVIGRFAFAHLRSAHLTGVPPPFPATLKTPALDRRPLQRFETSLSQSRSRRARSGPSAPSSISRTALLRWLRRSPSTPTPTFSAHTGSPVPRQRLRRAHATFTPGTARRARRPPPG